MDQNMPVMDGLQSTRAIKKIFKAYMEKEENHSKWDVRKTPIIALTANSTNQEKQACINAGMTEFLSKPPDMKEFLRILRGVFGD